MGIIGIFTTIIILVVVKKLIRIVRGRLVRQRIIRIIFKITVIEDVGGIIIATKITGKLKCR